MVCYADGANIYEIFDQNCNPDEHCVDFLHDNSNPFAMFIHLRKLLRFSNGHSDVEACSVTIRFDGNTNGRVSIGMTTYS